MKREARIRKEQLHSEAVHAVLANAEYIKDFRGNEFTPEAIAYYVREYEKLLPRKASPIQKKEKIYFRMLNFEFERRAEREAQ